MAKSKSSTNVGTGSFPTMGTSVAQAGVKAAPVLRGKSIKKTNQSKGGFLEAATAVHRPNIQESLGAKLHPTATLYAPNAASANEVQRNVYTVPSSMGNRDFYLRRRYNQGV